MIRSATKELWSKVGVIMASMDMLPVSHLPSNRVCNDIQQ